MNNYEEIVNRIRTSSTGFLKHFTLLQQKPLLGHVYRKQYACIQKNREHRQLRAPSALFAVIELWFLAVTNAYVILTLRWVLIRNRCDPLHLT